MRAVRRIPFGTRGPAVQVNYGNDGRNEVHNDAIMPCVRTELFKWQPPAPRKATDRWNDDAILQAVTAAYQHCVSSDYVLAKRPDRINRRSAEVDGLLQAADQSPIAIEVTALESFTGQLLDESRVEQLLGTLQHEIAPELPNGLWCIIPAHAFVAGFDWLAARAKITEHLRAVSPRLAPGSDVHEVEGLPFPVRLQYDPRLDVPFRFMRLAPPTERIKAELLVSMEKGLSHKKERLREYGANGYRTVLVLESSDAQLISWAQPYRAFLRAEQSVGSDHASDVVFAMTADHNRIYCLAFKGSSEFRHALNPVNLKFGPEYSHIWQPSTESPSA
jgi:hypothetical protein